MVSNFKVEYSIDPSIHSAGQSIPSVSVDALGPYVPTNFTDFNGEKFPGGFGITNIFTTDYWTLRVRSEQLFKDNLYAKGLIRRLITNEISS